MSKEKGVVLCPRCGTYEVRCESCARLKEEIKAQKGANDILADEAIRVEKYYKARVAALEEENGRLREAVEKASCGPRLDPSKCSSCNGTGVGSGIHPCICHGKGTVEGERDGYKIGVLSRILAERRVKSQCFHEEPCGSGLCDIPERVLSELQRRTGKE